MWTVTAFFHEETEMTDPTIIALFFLAALALICLTIPWRILRRAKRALRELEGAALNPPRTTHGFPSASDKLDRVMGELEVVDPKTDVHFCPGGLPLDQETQDLLDREGCGHLLYDDLVNGSDEEDDGGDAEFELKPVTLDECCDARVMPDSPQQREFSQLARDILGTFDPEDDDDEEDDEDWDEDILAQQACPNALHGTVANAGVFRRADHRPRSGHCVQGVDPASLQPSDESAALLREQGIVQGLNSTLPAGPGTSDPSKHVYLDEDTDRVYQWTSDLNRWEDLLYPADRVSLKMLARELGTHYNRIIGLSFKTMDGEYIDSEGGPPVVRLILRLIEKEAEK